MLIGTECSKVSKTEARNRIMAILDDLYKAQAALAVKDRESRDLANKAGRSYESLCYWDARSRFDPFVDYVAGLAAELTTGWFWPEGGDKYTYAQYIPCGFATFYHKEIVDKLTGFCDDVREYYEGTPLQRTWSKYDKLVRTAISGYRKMVNRSKKYAYGYESAAPEKKGRAKK